MCFSPKGFVGHQSYPSFWMKCVSPCPALKTSFLCVLWVKRDTLSSLRCPPCRCNNQFQGKILSVTLNTVLFTEGEILCPHWALHNSTWKCRTSPMAQEELSPQLGGGLGTVQMSKCHDSAYKESSLLSGSGGGDTWSCVPKKPAEVHLQFSWDLWDRGGRGRGGGPFRLPELSSHLLFTTAFLII